MNEDLPLKEEQNISNLTKTHLIIDSNKNIESKLQSIIKTICKKTPNLTELVDACFKSNSPIGIAEVITALSKLFSANEHQAAGIEALDPIIIQEGNIIQKYIDQIVTLHQKSILKPVIIIILKDNDFGRAKKYFRNVRIIPI